MVEGAAVGVEAAVVCGGGGGGELEDLPAHPWSLASVVVVVVVVGEESQVVVGVAAASLFSLADAIAWPSSELTVAEGVTGEEDAGMDEGEEEVVVDGGGDVGGGEEGEEEAGQGGAECDRSVDEGDTEEDGDEDEDGEDEEDGEEDEIVEDGVDENIVAVEGSEKADEEEVEAAAGESCEGSGVASWEREATEEHDSGSRLGGREEAEARLGSIL